MLCCIQAKPFSRPGMCRPPAGNLYGTEDVNHKAGGRTKDDSLRLLCASTNSPSSVSSRHKVRLNYAIEGLWLPRRCGGVFLPSTSAATNGSFFQSGELFAAVVSDEAPPDADLGESWLGPRWPFRSREPDLWVVMVHRAHAGPLQLVAASDSELHLCISPGSAQRRARLSNIENAYRAVYAAGSPRRAV